MLLGKSLQFARCSPSVYFLVQLCTQIKAWFLLLMWPIWVSDIELVLIGLKPGFFSPVLLLWYSPPPTPRPVSPWGKMGRGEGKEWRELYWTGEAGVPLTAQICIFLKPAKNIGKLRLRVCVQSCHYDWTLFDYSLHFMSLHVLQM